MCLFIFAKGGRPPLPEFGILTPAGGNIGGIRLFCCIYSGYEGRSSTHNGVFIHGRPGISAAFELEISVCVRVLDIISQHLLDLQDMPNTVLFPICISLYLYIYIRMERSFGLV